MKTISLLVIVAAMLLAAAVTAQAQDYPAGKVITAVVPYAAGGPTDKVAREISRLMAQYLGTQIVIENAGGAGGTIGARKVVQAKNDGYTILITSIGMATAQTLYRNLS